MNIPDFSLYGLKNEHGSLTQRETKMTSNTFDPTKVDLERMVSETPIPLGTIKVTLGLPITMTCDVATVAEARAMKDAAGSGSEEEVVALAKWNALSLAALETVTSLEEALDVYFESPIDSESEKEALRRVLKLCTNIEDAKEACKAFADASSGDHRAAILNRWVELCGTVEEVRAVLEETDDPSETRTAALVKLDTLLLASVEKATTIDEARDVCNNAPENSEARKAALAKWNALSLAALEATTRTDEMGAVWENASGDKVEAVVVQKWIKLCTTVEQAREAHQTVFVPYEEAVLSRWIELCTTAAEILEAYELAPEKSEVRGVAIRKLATFFVTPK